MAPKKIWQDSYQLYIGGKWRDAEDGKTFDVYNPANGEFMCKCAAASKADVDNAVKVSSSLEKVLCIGFTVSIFLLTTSPTPYYSTIVL